MVLNKPKCTDISVVSPFINFWNIGIITVNKLYVCWITEIYCFQITKNVQIAKINMKSHEIMWKAFQELFSTDRQSIHLMKPIIFPDMVNDLHGIQICHYLLLTRHHLPVVEMIICSVRGLDCRTCTDAVKCK